MSSSEMTCGGCEMNCETTCIGICADNCSSTTTVNVSATRKERVNVPITTKTIIRGTNTKYVNNKDSKR